MHSIKLSDDELVSRMVAACHDGHRLTAEIVSYLIEVEDRRLDLRSACRSLFDFCLRTLKMSEGMAFRRINAARLVRRFPCLLPQIARGELHLTGLVLLRDHLTSANVEELSAAACGLSETKLKKLIAARFPRAAVRDRLWNVSRSEVAPLSATDYLIQFTASAETHAKLERARELLLHAVPDGAIAAVVDRALDVLLAKLERDHRAKGRRPEPTADDSAAEKGARTTRREVFERDGAQCTYQSASGERCVARGRLELDHVQARARGGTGEAANLRVLCRAHNRLHAEEDFGTEHVAARIAARRQAGAEASASDVHFRHRMSTEPAGADVPVRVTLSGAPPSDEARAVRGLVGLGFKRHASARTVRKIMANGGMGAPLGEVLREAIGVLTTPG